MKQLQLGSMEPPKGGLGGNPVLTPSDDSEKLIFYIFMSKIGDWPRLESIGVPQDPNWARALSTKDEIGPQNPLQRNFISSSSKALEDTEH